MWIVPHAVSSATTESSLASTERDLIYFPLEVVGVCPKEAENSD